MILCFYHFNLDFMGRRGYWSRTLDSNLWLGLAKKMILFNQMSEDINPAQDW